MAIFVVTIILSYHRCIVECNVHDILVDPPEFLLYCNNGSPLDRLKLPTRFHLKIAKAKSK